MEQLENIIPAAKLYSKYQMEKHEHDLVSKENVLEDLEDEIVYPVITAALNPLIVTNLKDNSNLSENLT